MDNTFVDSLGVSLPRLGFGCMRMPEDAQGNIDVKQSVEMLHKAFAAGVTYFDTAYVYHGGKSESFLGEHFFSQLPRDSFMVATKLPVFRVRELADCEKLFSEQLQRLRVQHIDFYLAHSLSKESWQRFKALGGADYLRQIKEQGRVRHVGFSYHGAPEDLAEVIEDFPWEFVQLQINYYDWSPQIQNAQLQYEVTVAHNLPLIVMEPVRGGGLAALPQAADDILRKVNADTSAASWALRWVSGLPGVAITLSGMSDQQQVEDNLATFASFQPLNAAEQQAVEEVRQILYAQPHVGCTGCDYCKEACPQSIDISEAFSRYNDYLRLGHQGMLEGYLRFTPPNETALNCTACGSCKELCPQHLDIPTEFLPFNAKLREIRGEA